MNSDGTLLASVSFNEHCVYMYVYVYSVVDPSADAVVIGTAGTAGSSHGQFQYPRSACFVNRNGADTLLISDWGNDRIVEVTARGDFLRFIAMKAGSQPWGIAYCGVGDVIAVSLNGVHAVVLLEYESGAVKPAVTIGSATRGKGDGQLYRPRGVTFTADGRYILIADYWNDRVSKFSAASGAFIAHVISNGISYPRDVLQCEDGSIAVAHGCYGNASVVCVGQDGGTVLNIIIPSQSVQRQLSVSTLVCAEIGGTSIPQSLCSSLNGLVVKTNEGQVFLLRDAWIFSSRCAWLSALSCC